MEQNSIEVKTNRDYAHMGSTVIETLAGMQDRDLSARARLVAVVMASGVTSTAAIAKLLSMSDRAVRYAKAELAKGQADGRPAEQEFRAERKRASAQSGNGLPPKAEQGFRPGRNGVSADKKKGSPQTPLKEKTPPRTTVENHISVAARERANDATMTPAAPVKIDWKQIDLRELANRLTEAAGAALASQAIAPGLASMSTPIGWLEAGADLDRDVVPALIFAGTKLAGRQIRSWEYFSPMVAEARVRRVRGLPAVAEPKPSAPAQPSFMQLIEARIAARERGEVLQ